MTDKLSTIRTDLPAVQQVAFLNTGSCGPLPRVAAEAIARVTREEYEQGRASVSRFMQAADAMAAAREQLAALFNVSPETIAITHHTTQGMNTAMHGFAWQPGDEIVTTSIEHDGGVAPLYTVQHRYGVRPVFADIGLGEDPLPAIEAAITAKTRLIALSHVSYSSGARLPLEDIITLAHGRGIPVLVDAAQSAGAFALDLKALNVDYYAIPGQKWLCGPDGIGALYVREDRLAELLPTYVSGWGFKHYDFAGNYELAENALRFEMGMMYPATIYGLTASLQWFHETVEPAWAYDRIASLAAYTREALAKLDGVEVITPEHRQAGLVNFLPLGWSPAKMTAIAAELEKRGYVIRSIAHAPFCLRVSCGFYNSKEEIRGLCEHLADILAAGPESVEVPVWAARYHVSDEPVYSPFPGKK